MVDLDQPQEVEHRHSHGGRDRRTQGAVARDQEKGAADQYPQGGQGIDHRHLRPAPHEEDLARVAHRGIHQVAGAKDQQGGPGAQVGLPEEQQEGVREEGDRDDDRQGEGDGPAGDQAVDALQLGHVTAGMALGNHGRDDAGKGDQGEGDQGGDLHHHPEVGHLRRARHGAQDQHRRLVDGHHHKRRCHQRRGKGEEGAGRPLAEGLRTVARQQAPHDDHAVHRAQQRGHHHDPQHGAQPPPEEQTNQQKKAAATEGDPLLGEDTLGDRLEPGEGAGNRSPEGTGRHGDREDDQYRAQVGLVHHRAEPRRTDGQGEAEDG